jgi:uncharacterized protein YebE (UPF0316 family)
LTRKQLYYSIIIKEGVVKMGIPILLNSDIFTYVVLPVLIFISRVFDVSIGTLRIVFVSRGKKFLAPFLGFFEILIWVTAMGQIMQNLDSWICYVAYAGGFAVGSYVGLIIEERLALGTLIVRVILTKDEGLLKDRLSTAGYGVTVVNAEGASGEVYIVYTIIKRKKLQDVLDIIHQCNSKAFYSIEDARIVSRGIFPRSKKSGDTFNLFRKYISSRPLRKGK